MKWRKLGQIYASELTSDWESSYAAVPTAYHLSDRLFRIYYTGRDKFNRSQTGYIEIDIDRPKDILARSQGPVLRFGELGMFDEAGAMVNWVVPNANTVLMYYQGWNTSTTVPFRNSIGLAVSNDGGLTFTKYSNGPILDRSIYDPCFVATPCVVIEKIWRMWYLSAIRWDLIAGKPHHFYHIKYAESLDGISWERKGKVSIDFSNNDEYAISRPSVIKDGDLYKMWYSFRGQSYRIGYAESKDGINWERKDQQAGIDVSETGWDSDMIEYPNVFDCDGQRFMLYNGNTYGKTGFGLAVLE
jgi:predicted GH43/DUF377 family glycosyl hydrolase